MLDSWILSPDHRPAVIGGVIGAAGGTLALLVVLLGPAMAFAFAFGLAAAYYALTDLHGALYVTIAVIALLPFGKLPLPFSPSPTFLDGAIGAFMLVYALQWMSGQRRLFRSTPVTPIVLGFTGLMLFAYLMGLRHARLDPTTLRNVAEMVLSLLLIPVLVDVMRDEAMLRRAVLVLMLLGAASALIGIGLWLLPDMTAEALLNRLGRLDYPVGGVIRYRQTYGSILNERAIGTWIDPNAFGGFLLMVGAVIAPQVFSTETGRQALGVRHPADDRLRGAVPNRLARLDAVAGGGVRVYRSAALPPPAADHGRSRCDRAVSAHRPALCQQAGSRIHKSGCRNADAPGGI